MADKLMRDFIDRIYQAWDKQELYNLVYEIDVKHAERLIDGYQYNRLLKYIEMRMKRIS